MDLEERRRLEKEEIRKHEREELENQEKITKLLKDQEDQLKESLARSELVRLSECCSAVVVDEVECRICVLICL